MVARGIGQPTATRAVARACASNRAALLIPCHRVVRFYARLSLRILRPNWAALIPHADSLPHSLLTVLDQLDADIHELHEEAVFGA